MRILKSAIYLSVVIGCSGALADVAPVTDLNSSSPDQRLVTVERLIQQSNQRQLEVQQQLDALLAEVNDLRGETEIHSHKLEQLVERQRELYQELENRFSRYTATQTAQPLVTMPTSAATSVTTPPLEAVVYSDSVDENQAYEAAMNLVLKERLYDKAIPEFRGFLKRFPDSEYAPNAYYWLGQLLFNKGSYPEAKAQFERVVNFYPDSNKRSDAVYKLGSIALKNNNNAVAIKYFESVISEYPGSTSAKLAASRLQSIPK